MLNWGREAVALSSRRFLVAPDGSLYRLTNAKFDRMLRDRRGPVLPTFAGQRVRMADLVIEVAGRVPVRVVRSTFAVLPFDDDGRMAAGVVALAFDTGSGEDSGRDCTA